MEMCMIVYSFFWQDACGKTGNMILQLGQMSSMWSQRCIPCWCACVFVCAIKSWGMPLIPAKSYACMSSPWPLETSLDGKSRKGETRVPDAITGKNQLRETTPTENPRYSKAAGVEHKASKLVLQSRGSSRPITQRCIKKGRFILPSSMSSTNSHLVRKIFWGPTPNSNVQPSVPVEH